MTDYVGLFTCPTTHLKTPLGQVVKSIGDLEFPITVERCPACQQRHVLEKRDVKLSEVPSA